MLRRGNSCFKENKDEGQSTWKSQSTDSMATNKSFEQSLKEMLQQMKDDITQQITELKMGFEGFMAEAKELRKDVKEIQTESQETSRG